MSNKKILLLLLIIICLLVPSAVFANDNMTVNDSLEANYATSNSFSQLNDTINNNHNYYVELTENYTFNSESDSAFSNGITINRPVNIVGFGITIDGANAARIFNINSDDVFISNINFVNARSDNGGAIIGNNYGVINCNFSNNVALHGGAIYGGTSTNCNFNGNFAYDGGSIFNGFALNSNFTSNSAVHGGALYNSYAENSIFISNKANEFSGAIESGSALNCTFIGNSADIYGAGSFYADNCTFTDNTARDLCGALYGGAVNCIFTGNLADEIGALIPVGEIHNCTFISNHANNGGAIGGSGESINNCTFINNSADYYGGALNGVHAVDCIFKYNSANVAGALYEGSAINCTFISNTAVVSSGAIHGSADGCTFISNFAEKGGAIANGSVKNSIFESNTANQGGALYNISSLNCTFKSNQATEGGAMYAGSAIDCSFISNHADYGGAIAGSSSARDSLFIENVAEITGGAVYESSTENCYFEGNLPKYKLYVSGFDALYGFGGEIKVQLSDSPNYQIQGIKTTIKIYNSNNKLVETATCYSGYSYFVNLGVGKYTVTADVNDERYNVDTAVSYINIKKSTSIYVVNVAAIYNINNPLIVNLHDSNGVILKNAPVQITVNEVTKTYLTNNNGQVLFSTKGLVPKTYTAVINYAGIGIYAKSSASAKIIVKKANPIMLAYKQTFKVKTKIKTYSITLKNNLYQVMKNTKVTLKVNGKTYSAKTNSRGQAVFKITNLKKKGSFKAVVRYYGSNCYNAYSRTVVLTVKN